MGHPVQSQLTTDPDGVDYTFTTYDGLGRKHTVTNPYRSTSDSTYGTTTYTYDALGRTTLVTGADGSPTKISYCGPSTLVTDEAGHWRRTTNDGLGRLIEVDEPNSSTATVTACPQSGDPIVATTYAYDSLNNLTGVLQGGSRQRTFLYDSLSRLIASYNPESNSGTGTTTIPAQVATGTITITWNGGSSGDKILVYVDGTGTGNQCIVFFTGGESAAAVASGTASTINSDSTCSQYVTATASGGIVTLTALVSGTAGDYPFSASTNGTSYTVTTSGSTLTIGAGYSVLTGSTTYIYDPNGNLISKTGPAQNQTGSATVSLSYCYDALNRTTSKAYTAQSCPQATPVATYSYDSSACLGQASCYNVGHRTGMTDAAGSESWSYDKMGRVFTDQRTTNGITNSAIYTYLPYVDGSLYTLQYPSGRTITYSTGTADRLLSATDTANSIYYVTGAHYAPQGALSSLVNNDNVFSTYIYNKRLQPCWSYATTGTALATSTLCTATDSTPGNILDLQFNFNLGNGTTGTDNGNVIGITNNRDTTRSQAFSYDWLNRISVGETTSTDATSPAHCWGQQFGYDSWGNLLSMQGVSSAYNGCTQGSLSVTVTPQNQITGFTYDSAGNLDTIPGTGGASYVYDAENHLTSTAGVSYVYDGDGKRVEKSGSKIYWYGADGEVLDETNATGAMSDSMAILTATYPGCSSGLVCAATYTVASTAGINVGDSITVAGVSDWGFNGTYTVSAVGNGQVSAGSFTTSGSEESGGGTLTDNTVNGENTAFNEYIFFGGKRIARRDDSGDAFYYFADQLGTSRSLAEVASGTTTATLCYDADFYPFGGERAYTNTCAQNYKFTGKERDSESGLDNFGARYYASTMGRFMRPDDPFADQHTDQPQSWNLYTYVRNNPISLTDPDGNSCIQGADGKWVTVNDGGESCDQVDINNATNLTPSAQVISTPIDTLQDIPANELATQVANLTTVSNVAEVGRYGIIDAQLVLGAGELAEFFSSLRAAAQLGSARMAAVQASGKAGELAAGIVKNTEHIPSITGAAYRVPDILDDANKVIGEVKNYTTTTVSLTKQIKDDLAYASENGYSMVLLVRQGAKLSGPVQQLVSSGAIKLIPF